MTHPTALSRARVLGPAAVIAALLVTAVTAPGSDSRPAADAAPPASSAQQAEITPVGDGFVTHGSLNARGASSAKTLASTSYSLFRFDGDVARWDPCQTAITYRVNATLAGRSKKARRAAIRDVRTAFTHVSSASGLQFRYAGTTRQIPRGTSTWHRKQRTAEIVVAWIDNRRSTYRTDLVGGKSSGAGGTYFRNWVGSGTSTGAATRGYVVLNAQQNRMYRAGFGSGITRGRLLLHEIGHVVGLGHVSRRSQVMYPTARPAKSAKYRSGDRAGLKRLGTSAGCLNVPAALGPDLS